MKTFCIHGLVGVPHHRSRIKQLRHFNKLNPINKSESTILFPRGFEGKGESVRIQRREGILSVEVGLGESLACDGGAEIGKKRNAVCCDGEIWIDGVEGVVNCRVEMEPEPVTFVEFNGELVGCFGGENTRCHVRNLGQKRRVLERGFGSDGIATREVFVVGRPLSSVAIFASTFA